jgi:hypothetical protein
MFDSISLIDALAVAVVVLLVGDGRWQLLLPSSLAASTGAGARFSCCRLTLVLAAAAAVVIVSVH